MGTDGRGRCRIAERERGKDEAHYFFEGWRNRNLGRKVLGVVRAGKGAVVQFCRSKINASKGPVDESELVMDIMSACQRSPAHCTIWGAPYDNPTMIKWRFFR